jgi:hypothetical protein
MKNTDIVRIHVRFPYSCCTKTLKNVLVIWHLVGLTSCPHTSRDSYSLVCIHAQTPSIAQPLRLVSDVCVSKFICLHTPSCGSANTNGRLMWLALPLLDMHSSETAG